ncbi:MAG: hypothetical protein R3275_03560 [Saprospiraceae bacterium]|nr:hypothetical protein [Saprospiraceae bacterium]
MKKYLIYLLALTLTTPFLISCNDDDDDDPNDELELNISGLEDLGPDYLYEGWIIVDGAPVTTGTFSVDANGNLSQTEFEVAEDDLENAASFVLTIEPNPDNDPAPSAVHILAGDFDANEMADLSISHSAAIGNDFQLAAGDYILATPTNGMNSDELSGIWFLDASSGTPMEALNLPDLPAGWIYEGWVVVNGQPVTTGTFSSTDEADNAAPYSGTMSGPPFPGEDFLTNAPSGLSFPVDLSGGMAVISVEPVPDNSAAPFLLKPLVGSIPSDAMDHTLYSMGQNLSFPMGQAIR